MITRILLENFMAHERTELELGPGVNALTGPNNTGKSALVEGLRCVATNPIPKHYIRHGAQEARVTVELEDGTRIVWIRKKRSSGYEMWRPGMEEPQKYWKFGRKPPEEVLAALRLDLVELETGGEIDVHVGNQREPVFLLNQPGSNAAAFFAASTEGAHLLAMQNLLKRKTQETKRSERELEDRLDSVHDSLDAFYSLPGIEMNLEKAREMEAQAQTVQDQIPRLEKTLSTYGSLLDDLARQSRRITSLNAVQPVPALTEVRDLNSLITHMGDVFRAFSKGVGVVRVLSVLRVLPEIEKTSRLALFCDHFRQLAKDLRTARAGCAAMDGLSAPPVPAETSGLAELTEALITSIYRARREQRRTEVLQSVVEPPSVTECGALESLLGEIGSLDLDRQRAQERFDALEKQLETLKDDIAYRVGEVGCCPTCGADINAEAFLDRGGRHDG